MGGGDIMAKTLQMVFQNQTGKNVSISIGEVKDAITSEEIKTLMQLIVAKNIFESTGGDLTTIMSADIVTRDVQEMAVR
jgi:flagellar motor switch protein FliM